MANKVDSIKRKIRKIRQMQQDEAEKKGQRLGLMDRLEKEFDVKTLDAGADLLEEYMQIVDDNDKKLEELDGELDEITKLAETKEE